MANITLYTVKNDQHSHAASELVKQLGVDFREIDVTEDESAAAELSRVTGQWSVPALVVHDKADQPAQFVVGYEPEAIRRILKQLDQ